MQGGRQNPHVVDVEAADTADRVSQRKDLFTGGKDLKHAKRRCRQMPIEARGATTTLQGELLRRLDCDCEVIKIEEQNNQSSTLQASQSGRDRQSSRPAHWAASYTSPRENRHQRAESPGNKQPLQDKAFVAEELSMKLSPGVIAVGSAEDGVAADGEEQRRLWKDIVTLTHEGERETISEGDRGRQRRRNDSNNSSISLRRYALYQGDMDENAGEYIPYFVQDQCNTDRLICLQPSPHRSTNTMDSRIDRLRHIEVTEQEVTAKSLADAV